MLIQIYIYFLELAVVFVAHGYSYDDQLVTTKCIRLRRGNHFEVRFIEQLSDSNPAQIMIALRNVFLQLS